MPEQGDPVRIAQEYIANRDSMIERHHGAGRSLLGNASRVTQLQFIQMCNAEATRFADQMPMDWNIDDWDRFSSLDIKGMTHEFRSLKLCEHELNLVEWEGCKELASTYLALLRMRMTP